MAEKADRKSRPFHELSPDEQNSVAKLIIQLRNITRELQNLTGDNNYVWSLAQRFIINGDSLNEVPFKDLVKTTEPDNGLAQAQEGKDGEVNIADDGEGEEEADEEAGEEGDSEEDTDDDVEENDDDSAIRAMLESAGEDLTRKFYRHARKALKEKA